MHQRSKVDQLDDRRERHRARLRTIFHRAGQEQQRGTEQLSLHAHEVLLHRLDQGNVGMHDSPELLRHRTQLLTHWCLDVAQSRSQGCRRAPWIASSRYQIERRHPGGDVTEMNVSRVHTRIIAPGLVQPLQGFTGICQKIKTPTRCSSLGPGSWTARANTVAATEWRFCSTKHCPKASYAGRRWRRLLRAFWIPRWRRPATPSPCRRHRDRSGSRSLPRPASVRRPP
jgi:hypothetical protein